MSFRSIPTSIVGYSSSQHSNNVISERAKQIAPEDGIITKQEFPMQSPLRRVHTEEIADISQTDNTTRC